MVPPQNCVGGNFSVSLLHEGRLAVTLMVNYLQKSKTTTKQACLISRSISSSKGGIIRVLVVSLEVVVSQWIRGKCLPELANQWKACSHSLHLVSWTNICVSSPSITRKNLWNTSEFSGQPSLSRHYLAHRARHTHFWYQDFRVLLDRK